MSILRSVTLALQKILLQQTQCMFLYLYNNFKSLSNSLTLQLCLVPHDEGWMKCSKNNFCETYQEASTSAFVAV